jgi:biotin transport system substrate-specific component
MTYGAVPRPTLIQVAVPQTGLLRDALLILGFSLVIALSAQVAFKLPFTDIPVTGQTFGVLLTGAVLGSRRGALAVGVYLMEGVANLPVFALGNTAWTATRFGVPYIAGPTAGFLIGFPVAAYAVGLLAERGWDRSIERSAIALLIGNLLLYLPGIAWLARYVGPENAVPLGLLPFIPGDLLKLFVAAAVLPGAWKLLGKPPGWDYPRKEPPL